MDPHGPKMGGKAYGSVPAMQMDAVGLTSPPSPEKQTLFARPLSSTVQWYSPAFNKAYSRRELIADHVVNLTGMVLAWIAGPWMVYASWAAGDVPAKQLGFLAQAIGMIVMTTHSAALHHFSYRWDWAPVLIAMDHMGINAMIVGCYCPPALQFKAFRSLGFVVCLGAIGWVMEVAKLLKGSRPAWAERFGLVRYLLMGWALLILTPYMIYTTPWLFTTYLTGGLVVSLGVPIFIRTQMEFHQAVWHLASVTGAFIFYLANLLILVGRTPPFGQP